MKPPIQNLKLIREARKMSREDVASKLDIKLSAYSKIENGETGLTIERLYELADIFKMSADEILTYNNRRKGNVTYVPIEAQAGLFAGHSQEYMEFKTYHLPFVDGKNLYMIDASGDSMFPTIIHGDHIIIEQVEDIKLIKFGKAYVIHAKDGCVIKRIHSHESQKKFLLKSDNHIYEPYEIEKKDVLSLWLVKDYKLTNLNSISRYLLPENSKQKGDSQQKK